MPKRRRTVTETRNVCGVQGTADWHKRDLDAWPNSDQSPTNLLWLGGFRGIGPGLQKWGSDLLYVTVRSDYSREAESNCKLAFFVDGKMKLTIQVRKLQSMGIRVKDVQALIDEAVCIHLHCIPKQEPLRP